MPRLLIISFLFVLLFNGCSEEDASNPFVDEPAAPGSLVFSDEFNYSGLPDPDKWGYDEGGSGWGNDEEQYYTRERIENAKVENGILTITAIKEEYSGNQYTSARLVTAGKGDWLYGRIEVRAKIPRAVGTWPAIWMLPTDWVYGGWPSSGEIDIMEHVGWDPKVVHGSVHTALYNHKIGTQKSGQIVVDDPFDEFHVYRIDWFADRIEFYLDDNNYYTFYNENKTEGEWPFDQEFHLILNIAIGGAWGGIQGIQDESFPQKMEIDYVRIYASTE
ncbi:MAG: glycoside hydrolase family 16 protein [Melioribacteraceae bacterium]|nr:glycoside hydrolase family 16 protein [Melioribacteraceae bacterium]MCF8265033.1 glycoside hydrolase family 16 protein [Melioribacteraceae bacterium]MCF8431647.1 glycoside hydrolase family 16 protein [Melioribacteraceae bacterium]